MDVATHHDVWATWLLTQRDGGNPEFARRIQADIERYADHVLRGAHLTAGMTLADVGAGDGLVSWRAIAQTGPTLRVILVDISADLLWHAEAQAQALGVHGQCRFLRCGAQQLTTIEDSSLDALVTRAALAYVEDKPAALREFARVLKPGGHLSIGEPIFQDDALFTSSLRSVLADPAIPPDEFLPLLLRWKAAQYPDTPAGIAANPLTNYSERDLVRFARSAGFINIHAELHIDVTGAGVPDWDTFLRTAPHPWAPPLQQILAERFTAPEQETFERSMRPQIEDPQAVTTSRIAFLSARKPSS